MNAMIMNAIYFACFLSLLMIGVIITNIMILYKFPLVVEKETEQEQYNKKPLEDMKDFIESDTITKELTRSKRKFRKNI